MRGTSAKQTRATPRRPGERTSPGHPAPMPGHTYHSFPHPVELHPNVSRSDGGARQDHVLDLGGQAEEAVGVVGGVDLVSEAEVGQVVHVDPIPKGHGDGVLPQPDPEHRLLEGQLPDFPRDVIVPDQHAVRGRVGRSSAPHDRHEVAPEQHLHDPDPALQLPADAHRVLRVQVVDREPLRRPHRQAPAVLVEGAGQERRNIIRPRRRRQRRLL